MRFRINYCALLSIILLSFSFAFSITIEFEEKNVSIDKFPTVRQNEIKNEAKKIAENFGDKVAIHLSKEYPEQKIIHNSDTMIMRKIFPLLRNARTMNMWDSDSAARGKAFKYWEDIGTVVCGEAGYPTSPLFSLRIENPTQWNNSMAKKQSDTATGTIFLIEYYDGIRVAGSYVYVGFEKGIVTCINFNAAGITSPRVENKKPKYTFNEVLQNYLAIKKEVPKYDADNVELVYIVKNNTYPPTLVLCWSFTIFFRANSFRVMINAATRELESEGGGQKQAQNISGRIY